MQDPECETGHRGVERLATGYDGRLSLALAVGWIGVTIGRQLLPPMLPTIIGDLGITPFQAGVGLTLLWATYALIHYPGGRLADRLSRKTVVVGGLILLIFGFVILGFAVNYYLFLIAVAVIGSGGGLYFISMRSTAADLYVHRRAQAFGIQYAFGNFGAASAAGVAVVVLSIATWRSAFIPLAAFVLVVAIVLHFWMDEPYVVRRIEMDVVETGTRLLSRSKIRHTLVIYVLYVFAWQGVVGFLPTFLQVEKEFSPFLASVGFAIIFVVGMGVGPIAGVAGDRYGKLRVAVGSLIVASLGLSALVWGHATSIIVGSVVVFAVGLWAFPPVMQAYLMDTFDEDSMGGDLGALKTIWAGIGSLGTSYVGFVAGFWTYAAAFIGLIGSLLLALLMVTWIRYKSHNLHGSRSSRQ